MNRTKLNNSNDNSNKFEVAAKLHPRIVARINGTPEGVRALSESLKRGDAYLQAQKKINEVCLPTAPVNSSNSFVVKKACIICFLILGASFASMAQSKPSPKTNITVVSQGRKVVLTCADTTYLNNSKKSVRSAISNYHNGGVIKNNDIADIIFTLLKNRN